MTCAEIPRTSPSIMMPIMSCKWHQPFRANTKAVNCPLFEIHQIGPYRQMYLHYSASTKDKFECIQVESNREHYGQQ